MKFECYVCKKVFEFEEAYQRERKDGMVIFLDERCYNNLKWMAAYGPE